MSIAADKKLHFTRNLLILRERLEIFSAVNCYPLSYKEPKRIRSKSD